MDGGGRVKAESWFVESLSNVRMIADVCCMQAKAIGEKEEHLRSTVLVPRVDGGDGGQMVK